MKIGTVHRFTACDKVYVDANMGFESATREK
jgi:hypothetical protein